MSTPTHKRWLPLESNPDVLSKFSWRLGLPNTWSFHDIFGTDPDLLALIPQPVLAILLLFPITEKYELARQAEAEDLEANPQFVSDHVFFTKQVVGNACGTIGVVHSILNNAATLDLEPGFFADFLARTRDMTPMERAEVLAEDDTLEEAHTDGAAEGQTKAEEYEDTSLHFVCLTQVDGILYELDGRKSQPINHGPTTPDTLLSDAAVLCRKFMDVDPDNLLFNMIALAVHTDE